MQRLKHLRDTQLSWALFPALHVSPSIARNDSQAQSQEEAPSTSPKTSPKWLCLTPEKEWIISKVQHHSITITLIPDRWADKLFTFNYFYHGSFNILTSISNICIFIACHSHLMVALPKVRGNACCDGSILRVSFLQPSGSLIMTQWMIIYIYDFSSNCPKI